MFKNQTSHFNDGTSVLNLCGQTTCKCVQFRNGPPNQDTDHAKFIQFSSASIPLAYIYILLPGINHKACIKHLRSSDYAG